METIKKLKQIVYGEYSRFADFADKKMYARGLAERDSLFAALDELGQLRAEKQQWQTREEQLVRIADKETDRANGLKQQLATTEAQAAAMRQALVDIRDHHDNEGYANYQVNAMRRIAGEALEGKND